MAKQFNELTEKGKKQSYTKLFKKCNMYNIKLKFALALLDTVPNLKDKYILRFNRDKI